METGVLTVSIGQQKIQTVGVFAMAEYINGNCTKCGCYWGASDDVLKAVGCECACHE